VTGPAGSERYLQLREVAYPQEATQFPADGHAAELAEAAYRAVVRGAVVIDVVDMEAV
jgi:hypothetical protein